MIDLPRVASSTNGPRCTETIVNLHGRRRAAEDRDADRDRTDDGRRTRDPLRGDRPADPRVQRPARVGPGVRRPDSHGIETTRETAPATPRPAPQPPVEYTSWGQTFVESDQFRTYNGHGQSGRFELDGFLELRAAITTANLAIPHFVLPPVEYQTTAPLLEVCGRVMVSSGVVDWVEVGGDPRRRGRRRRRRQAGGGVHGHPEDGGAGHDRPLGADHPPSPRGRHLHPVADRGQAAPRPAQQGRGGHGRRDASSPCRPLPTRRPGRLLAAIRVGIGKVEAAGFNPNAVALNPADYAALDVAVMGATVAGPVQQPTFWGLRPVAAGAIPAGKAYVGDFEAGATLFDRGVTNVFLSDSPCVAVHLQHPGDPRRGPAQVGGDRTARPVRVHRDAVTALLPPGTCRPSPPQHWSCCGSTGPASTRPGCNVTPPRPAGWSIAGSIHCESGAPPTSTMFAAAVTATCRPVPGRGWRCRRRVRPVAVVTGARRSPGDRPADQQRWAVA